MKTYLRFSGDLRARRLFDIFVGDLERDGLVRLSREEKILVILIRHLKYAQTSAEELLLTSIFCSKADMNL